jgi:hypothetical protein
MLFLTILGYFTLGYFCILSVIIDNCRLFHFRLFATIINYFILGYFRLCEIIVGYFLLLKTISPFVYY